MRFHNSLRLLMENFKHVYKLLIAKLIIGLVACALCCAFVLPEIYRIWNSEAVHGLVENLKEFFKTIFSANPTEMEAIKNAILGEGGSVSQVSSYLSSMTLEIVLSIVGCAIVYLLKRFAETICHFTTGCMLNDKMASYAETKYSAALIANLGKASVYSVVYVPLVFLFDVIMITLVGVVLSFAPILIGLFVSITLIAILQSLKLTVTSTWMPAMTVDGKKLSQSMRSENKVERRQKFKTFSTYLVSVYAIIIVNVVAAVCTFGSALIITLPASYFFLICMQYVNYYTIKGKKYFLTYEKIETNLDHGDSEHFFEYVEEEEAHKENNL